MRSKLFVPGSRPELFAKALASDADAISFDVEDSVPEDGKTRAREQIADFLRSAGVREALRKSAKIIIVSLLRSALAMQSARMIWAEGEALDIWRDMRSGGITGRGPSLSRRLRWGNTRMSSSLRRGAPMTGSSDKGTNQL
jgi:hypothetical protein